MKTDVWKMLEEYFDDTSLCGTGVSEKQITIAEKILKLEFSNAYKKFLKQYDSACLPGNNIYGVFFLPGDQKFFIENVIINTIYMKNTQNWPDIDDWYIISDDGRGNPIGINPKGEVLLSDHDSGFEQIKLADDFEEFVYRLLTDTLYE